MTVDKEGKKGEKEMKKNKKRKQKKGVYIHQIILLRINILQEKKNRNKKQKQEQLKVKEIDNCEDKALLPRRGGGVRKKRQKKGETPKEYFC